MTTYLQKFSETDTPQSEALPGQVANSAGGYSFAVSDMERLRRFLILGSQGGSYYASERKLTKENIEGISTALDAHGTAAVDEIVAVSVSGRAPKNDYAIYALAIAASHSDLKVRQAALAHVNDVCRIATHLFMFLGYVKTMRGSGRGLKRAIANWYTSKNDDALALQVVKYRQREGFTHLDAMRIGHPGYFGKQDSEVLKWIVKPDSYVPIALIQGFVQLQAAPDAKRAAELIRQYNLPRECVPTDLLKEAVVWDALLEKMPMTAMIRNLGNMSKVGLLTSLSDAARTITGRLRNQDALTKARIHPLNVLFAQSTYRSGQGLRGSSTWDVVQPVVDALEDAYYLAFGNITPTGKRYLLGIDVSGSMGGSYALRNHGYPYGFGIAGTGLSPAEGAAAMAMVTARTETQYMMMGFANTFRDLGISAKDSLRDVLKKTTSMNFGSTDCAVPMTYAEKNELAVDTFIVYTDSETWAGSVHPPEALKHYRKASGIPARLIVVGMVSNGFTIADPNDAGMLDVVGFDTATPQIISDFSVGNI